MELGMGEPGFPIVLPGTQEQKQGCLPKSAIPGGAFRSKPDHLGVRCHEDGPNL